MPNTFNTVLNPNRPVECLSIVSLQRFQLKDRQKRGVVL